MGQARENGRFAGQLTDALVEELSAAHESGLGLAKAAEACGVDPRRFREWRERGRREEGTIYERLAVRMTQAAANFELTHLKRIAEGNPRWQASAWLLERTRQERYALIQRVETGTPGAFYEKMTNDELKEEITRQADIVKLVHSLDEKAGSSSGKG